MQNHIVAITQIVGAEQAQLHQQAKELGKIRPGDSDAERAQRQEAATVVRTCSRFLRHLQIKLQQASPQFLAALERAAGDELSAIRTYTPSMDTNSQHHKYGEAHMWLHGFICELRSRLADSKQHA